MGSHSKVVKLAEALFSQDISSATYIAYSSDRNVVGFQLNGTSDGRMLDGLPALAAPDSSTPPPPLLCSYSLSSTHGTFLYGGATDGVRVTTTTGCSWTASSSVSWMTIISGWSGNGTGEVWVTVSPNSSTSDRTGTLTIAGITIPVVQYGAPAKVPQCGHCNDNSDCESGLFCYMMLDNSKRCIAWPGQSCP